MWDFFGRFKSDFQKISVALFPLLLLCQSTHSNPAAATTVFRSNESGYNDFLNPAMVVLPSAGKLLVEAVKVVEVTAIQSMSATVHSLQLLLQHGKLLLYSAARAHGNLF